MANVATIPAEGQILVNIEDMSMLKDIKKAISMVKGVGKITLPRRRKLYSAYELSLRDLDEGRVYEAKDVDDLFRQCLEEEQSCTPSSLRANSKYRHTFRPVQ